MLEPVPENINFPAEEENVAALWSRLQVFKTCLQQSKGRPKYSFYDGPPFATGLPHYGHILAGTIKDVVTRYAHQSGFHVERRFGWDCHGLPVEFEIDKALGIKGPDDVAKMGIAAYNGECRKIVMRYASDWERIVTRLGRWIDFENDYKTLYPSFMESIWWVFGELYAKGLVYRGVKVMPYSTACNTPLSNFESGQNYKEVVDPAVVVGFPLVGEEGTSLLAWTTTPWTLPSNLALCVNPELEYVRVRDESGKKFVVMRARLESVYKREDQYVVEEAFKGSALKDRRYVPLFPYFGDLASNGAFRILNDGYVTEQSGTGIVHQAPYFGEDDYRVCLAAGVISRDQDIVCPVDASGRFVLPVSDFAGQYVKDADKEIVKYLKTAGRLFSSATVKHSYPFCWRSETPLIYKAVPSWFVRVEHTSEALLASSAKTHWVPDFVKEKRFGNWLRDARDWAVSRNRYWGTPIPLWVSEDGEEVVCVSSIAELERRTGEKITDIHRESIDHLTIPSSRPGGKPLRRVSEVFDCWFESGSMPYAQKHYPFENRKEFDDSFPADFIAEGIDQTRGWFYTLIVISTALFGKAPFKNLIANGLILAGDGQKMSKRKKNYPDPLEVVNKFGADALRLYLINSPVVRAENLRFKEEGVRDVLKDVFLPWYNAYRFLVQNLQRAIAEDSISFAYNETSSTGASANLMDRWILSFAQSLLQFVKTEMAAYRLYTVVPRLVKFIDNLTNWYVRMNRRRLRGECGVKECEDSLQTLFAVLYAMVRIMAPFTPYLSELMYQNLRHMVAGSGTKEGTESVHYLMLPEPRTGLIDQEIENAVSLMQTIIELGRVIRDRKTIPIKYPLQEVVVIVGDEDALGKLKGMEEYVCGELNVRRVVATADKSEYGVTLRAEPDHKTLGLRLKGVFKAVTQAIKAMSDADVRALLATGHVDLLGNRVESGEVRVMYGFEGTGANAERYEAHSEGDVLVLLDVTPDRELTEEGYAREVVNRVQKLRKKARLVPTDRVEVYFEVSPPESDIAAVTASHGEFIEAAIRAPFKGMSAMPAGVHVVIEETQQLKGADIRLVLTGDVGVGDAGVAKPNCAYVNVRLGAGLEPRYGAGSDVATVLLENPTGENVLTLTRLATEVENVFGLHGRTFLLSLDGKSLSADRLDASAVAGKTLVASPTSEGASDAIPGPACRFINVERSGRKGVCLLENPRGRKLVEEGEEQRFADTLLR